MNKTITALLVAAAFSSSAHAITVYQDDANSLSIGGRLGAIAKFEGDTTELRGDSARINFVYGYQFQSGWAGVAVAEWGFNELDVYNDDGTKTDLFYNRLGNVGLAHEQWGSFTLGKQWSAYFDVAGWTDKFTIGGAHALGVYDDGNISGTSRPDDAFIYRNTINNFNIAVQYQFEANNGEVTVENDQSRSTWHRESGHQLSLSYDFEAGLSLGMSYGKTIYKNAHDVEMLLGAVKYSSDKLYLAAGYGQFENLTNKAKAVGSEFDRESRGTELFAQYYADDLLEGLSFLAGYNHLDVVRDANNQSTDAELINYMLGATYTAGPMLFGVEYTFNDSKDATGDANYDNVLEFNARYYF
ncbi:porin [Photobacterium sanctipauli]|uniref:Porin n=1 Tax=Photobacterium sanctipauli TaxID=1342794 RepID=A0A2T3NBM0_9GAMM|nr:porin [Photobacterium sanctipauli]PSW11350.1 porin [Photobacterium sanctipauli]